MCQCHRNELSLNRVTDHHKSADITSGNQMLTCNTLTRYNEIYW